MRNVIAPLTLVLLLGMIVPCAQAQIIHLDTDTVDFGNMNQLESRDTEVVITNKGGGMLVINEVKADCGCTVPTLTKKELGPGESTVMAVNFNSKQFHGNVVKMIHLFSNDPDNPDAIFFIQATVHAPLLMEPESQRLGFSQTPIGTIETKQMIFTATAAPTLEIKAKKSRKNLFDVSVINNYEGNPQKSALVVTIKEDMPAGRQRDNVRVQTNLETKKYVDIELSAWPVLSLRTSVDKINYRYKKDLTKTIQVLPHAGEMKYKVTKVECDLPELKIKVEEVTPNHQTTIRLSGTAIEKDTPRATKSKGRIKGTLIIHTDLKDLPTLEIPISYMIRM